MVKIIKIAIYNVYEGYEYKDNPEYRKNYGYWVIICFNDNPTCKREWRKNYDELKADIFKLYGIELPTKAELRFKNYGEPYNIASIYPPPTWKGQRHRNRYLSKSIN